MRVNEIYTSFEHEIDGKKHTGSFLKLEGLDTFEHHLLTEFANSMSRDAKTKKYLQHGYETPSELLVWLISVDGNFIVLRHLSMDAADLEVDQDTRVEKLPWELQGHLEDMLSRLRELSEKDRDFNRRIFRHAALRPGKIQNRITLSFLREASLEAFYEGAVRALKDPYNASYDQLALAVIANQRKTSDDVYMLEKCTEELRHRYLNGADHGGSLFGFTSLSPDEIFARRDRARDSFVKFNNRFPAERCVDNRVVEYRELNWAVNSYLDLLSDDVLLELLLVFYVSTLRHDERLKFIYGAASARQYGNEV